MGGLRQEESVQGWLKKQMRENEFDGDGGNGDLRGGGGGGGGGGDGSGGEDDESISGVLDEVVQVILATIGFIFVVTTKYFFSKCSYFIVSDSFYDAVLGCFELKLYFRMFIILHYQNVQL